jgi:hypothetical protein
MARRRLTIRRINMRKELQDYIKTRDPKLLKVLRTEEINFANRPENLAKSEPIKPEPKKPQPKKFEVDE